MRREEAIFRDVIGYGRGKLPVTALATDFSNPKDADLKKAVACVGRAIKLRPGPASRCNNAVSVCPALLRRGEVRFVAAMKEDPACYGAAFDNCPSAPGHFVALVKTGKGKRDAFRAALEAPVEVHRYTAESQLALAATRKAEVPRRHQVDELLVPLLHADDAPCADR